MSVAGVDLDDPVALRDADATGALLHASMAGAQLRAVDAAADAGALDPVRGVRPRAVVWVTGRSGGARDAATVVAAAADHLGGASVPPLVPAHRLPAWAGALDVVLVSGDDAGDPEAERALVAAGRRGAALVVDAPREGPLAEAAPDDACWIPPLPFLPPHRGLLRHVGAGAAVLTALGVPGLDVAAAADVADAELSAVGPEIATAVNPAKLLATSLAGAGATVWAHADPVAESLCRRAAAAFAEAGRPGAVLSLADAVRAEADRAAVSSALGRAPRDAADRLFHDEFLDGTWEDTELLHLAMVVTADDAVARRVAAALPLVEWVTDTGDDAAGAPPAPDLGRIVALMARIELAAAYHLVGGR